MKELVPFPVLQVNQEVRYMTFKADITGCLWSGTNWMYEVDIRRGKKKGSWLVTEETLLKENK